MNWRRTFRSSAIVLGILVVVLSGVIIFLHTSMFRRYLVHKVEEAAALSTGGRVQIGSLEFELMPLSVSLRNIVIHGTETGGEPPLLQVGDLTVKVTIRSLLRREIDLRELVIRGPVVNLRVSDSGTNNMPQAPPTQSHTNVFALAIARFALTDGEIVYNDKKASLSLALDNVHSEISFRSPAAYTGFISYANGRLTYAQHAALPNNARIQFTATPSGLSVDPAIVTAGSSVISIRGEIQNFGNPTVHFDYDIHLHPEDFAALTPSLRAEGQVHLTGTLRYANSMDQAFVRTVAIAGRLESNGVSATTARGKFYLRTIQGSYKLANGSLQASDFKVNALGGQVAAEAEICNLDTTPAVHVRAALRNISLRDVQSSLGAAGRDQVAFAGTVAGSTDASWIGNIENIHVHSDLTVLGEARNAGASSDMLPIDATIHAVYDGPKGVLALHQSSVRTPSLALTADGEVSKNSSLKIHAQADDLHQLFQIASSFGYGNSGVPAVSGSATMETTLRGSLQRPQISGELNAANLHVQGSDWKSARISFAASPQGISVSDGSLVNANQGRASFAATVQLRDWHYVATSPIQAELSARKIALADLQRVANVQYPISGDLSAHISLNGTQLNPSGSGSLEVGNGRVCGEPLQALTLSFDAANRSVTANLNLSTSAGSATATVTYTPETRAYKLRVDAPAIVLQKVHRLQSSHGLKATISASANGEGTLDNPQLTATVQVAQLEVQHKLLGNINSNLRLAGNLATLTLDSQLSQSSIRARAQVELTGQFQTDAAIDTGPIPLDALWTSFSNGAPEGFEGRTELHATLKGPLMDKTQIEAHVNIPTLSARYQQLQIAAASPIRIDYAHSVVALQPAEIVGTDTTLQIQGNVPLAGSAVPSLIAKGQVNMQILRIFAPDLESSGAVAIDLHAAGSAKAPSLQGQIRLQNINLVSANATLGVDKLNGILQVDSDRVQLSNVTAQVGSGQVSLGGAVTYRPNLQFALLLQGKSIRLRYPQGLRSELDSTLSLTGNAQAATLNGRVLIDSLSFTPDFDLTSFGDQFAASTATPAQPGLADKVRLNVAVQSKQNLGATSSQVTIEGRVDLNVTGSAADPVVTGRTELTSGELFYRSNRYQLQRGVITFADPNQTNPNLNVSVTTSVEQYNLTINLHGTLDRLTTNYSSDPPLSTIDIIHLIAFGNTTSESAANNASESTDAMVASSAVGAGLTSGVQKLAGFSSLQIDPLLGGNNQNPSARIALQQRVTKNFLFTFSTDVSQPGEEVVQGDYQISPHWSVNVTRDQLGGVTVAGRLHTKF